MTEGKQQEKTCVDLRDIIHAATCSYKITQCLSIILLAVLLFFSFALFTIAVWGFIRNGATWRWSLVFGGLGTANVIVLLLYRPIERMQSRVDALIKTQVVCLSFTLQHDSIKCMLERMPAADTDYDTCLKVIQSLRDSTTQLIADLAPVSSATEPDS